MKNNLMWEDTIVSKQIKLTWQEAIDYCEASTLGGYNDWRLPNYNELYYLSDRSKNTPAISDVFENIIENHYITSTTYKGNTSEVWNINFNYGINSFGAKSTAIYVRCVRDTDAKEPLHIKYAVYNDMATSDPNDDRLYLYFSESIKESSLLADMSQNFSISGGTGVIGSDSSHVYEDGLFHRLTILLNSTGSASTAFDGTETIKIATNSITDMSDEYPLAYFTTDVAKFNILGRIRTGQTTSYSANDDGDTLRGFSHSYSDNGDGSVTDNNTHLIWQQEDDGSTYTYSNAITYCDNLNDNWRLPTHEELMSIGDKGRIDPSINPIFLNTQSNFYWSVSFYISNNNIWMINSYNGYNYHDAQSNSHYVRCVKNSEYENLHKYVRDDTNDIMIDEKNNLMWHDDSNTKNTQRTWSDAISYCESSNLGGYNDWHLPNYNELYYLANRDKYRPAIDIDFYNVENSQYWSSTTYKYNTNDALAVDFSDGLNNNYTKSTTLYVRRVRVVD
jgi:hypothetical protein